MTEYGVLAFLAVLLLLCGVMSRIEKLEDKVRVLDATKVDHDEM